MAPKPAKKGVDRKKLITPVFRVSFPNLFEARRADEDDPNSKPKFGCSAIWTPAKFTEKEKVLWKAMLAELDRESRKAFDKPWKELRDPYKKGLRDGASKEMTGYGEGTRFANLTTKNRPGICGPKIDPETGKYEVISEDNGNAEEIYPGCYCRATVTVYSFSNKGKGVAIGLRSIQKVKDGPRLDSRVAAEDDFDEEIESSWLDQDDDFDNNADTDDEEIPF